jgi:hypothetical protein
VAFGDLDAASEEARKDGCTDRSARYRKYVVCLTDSERSMLEALVREGLASPRAITRAKILLRADCSGGRPGATNLDIARELGVMKGTVSRIRRIYVTEGLQAAVFGQ